MWKGLPRPGGKVSGLKRAVRTAGLEVGCRITSATEWPPRHLVLGIYPPACRVPFHWSFLTRCLATCSCACSFVAASHPASELRPPLLPPPGMATSGTAEHVPIAPGLWRRVCGHSKAPTKHLWDLCIVGGFPLARVFQACAQPLESSGQGGDTWGRHSLPLWTAVPGAY